MSEEIEELDELSKEHIFSSQAEPTDIHSLPDNTKIQRFGPLVRIQHLVLIIVVNNQFFTGLPMYYSRASWAQWMFKHLGGVPTFGVLHRIGGVIFLSIVVMHACWLAYYLLVKKGQFYGERSMLPRLEDAHQLIGHIKYALGRGSEPKWSRFAWYDKFGWIGVFWGSVVIGLPGLILFAKDYAVALPLPPQVFNIATILHADEAILAMGFLFIFHWYNTHWMPGKFPMSAVIITGMLTKKEMEEERPAEFEALAKDPQWLAKRLEHPDTRISTKRFPSK